MAIGVMVGITGGLASAWRIDWHAMSASPAPLTPAAADDDKLDRGVLLIASVVVLGAIMSILDVTVVNVAISSLAREFDTSLSTIQWVSTGYTLALATVIPLTGWAADRFGTKRLYLTSITLFVGGSMLSGLAWSAELADRLPRPAGLRRRHADAARHDDPHAGGRARTASAA